MAADTFMARSGGDDSPKNDLRYALNKQSSAMHEDHPFVGIGWNNYGLANSRPTGMKYSAILERWEANRGQTIYPENFMANPLTESLYWLLLAETGTLGFATFLLFALVTLWFGLRSTIAFWKTPIGLLCCGLTVSLAVMYFHLQVERIVVQTKNLTTWIMLCAIVARIEWWRRDQKRKKKLAAG
jgi:O-antigen ligase